MTTEEPTKKCSKCGEVKPLSAFPNDNRKIDGKRADCRSCRNAYKRALHARNPGPKRESDKRYREANKSEIAAKQKAYRDLMGEELLAKKRAYHHATKPARQSAAAAYLETHREENRQRSAAWYRENKERALEVVAKWVAENPEASRAIKKRYRDKRRSTPQGKLESNISRGVHRGLLPGAKANTPTFKLLPYTPQELAAHLERQFAPGMSWDNYGKGGWHVDHIRPLASFTYETPADPEFKMAWALSNLQPLWWRDNMAKNAKWPYAPPANDNGVPGAKSETEAA